MLLLHSELCYQCEENFYLFDFRRKQNENGMSAEYSVSHGRVRVVLHAKKPCTLHRVKLTFSYPFSRETAIFLNGYQSATACYERGVQDKEKGIGGLPAKAFSALGDYDFYEYPNKPGKLHGYTYGYFREDKRYTLIGSLSEKEGFTTITTDALSGIVEVQKECEGVTFTGDLTVFDLCIFRGGEETVFDAYFEAMGIARPAAKPFFGYQYRGRLTQNPLSRDILTRSNAKCKPDVYLLDTGKEAVEDRLFALDDTFSSGMKSLAAAIKRRGMIPGITLTPFVCSKDTALYGAHPDLFLTDENGEEVAVSYRGKTCYALDLDHRGTREHIRKLIQTVHEDWGFDFIRLDGLYAACRFPKAGNTRGGVMCEAMAFLRECAGSAMLYACDVPLGAAFGTADYCAVTPDPTADWDGSLFARLPYLERPSTKAAIMTAVFRRGLNGRAFLSCAGNFTLDKTFSRLTAAQKTWLSKVQSTCASVLMTADDLSKYGFEKMAAVEELLKLRDYRVLSAQLQKDKLFVCTVKESDVNALLIPFAGK